MIDRRQIMLGLVSLAALATQQAPLSAALPAGKIGWLEFTGQMRELSERFAAGGISQQGMEREGLALISRLDIEASSFAQAEGNAFESGNAFWLWQRMIRTRRLDGGILNIDRTQMIRCMITPMPPAWCALSLAKPRCGSLSVLTRTDMRRARPN